MAGKFIIQKQADGTYRFSLMRDNEEIGFAEGFEQLDAAKRAVKAVKKSCRAKVQAVGEELGFPKYALGQDGKSFSLIAQNGARGKHRVARRKGDGGQAADQGDQQQEECCQFRK